MIKLMMPDRKGERCEEFAMAVVETELQQKLGASEYIASIYSWGTFDGKSITIPLAGSGTPSFTGMCLR